MDTEFEIAGHRYRAERMTAQTETRIVKRLALIVSELIPLVFKPGKQLIVRPDLDIQSMLRRTSALWSRLPDDDLDYIERSSLGALSREANGEWHTVWPAGLDEPAFADIDGASMQRLTGHRLGLAVKAWIDGGGDAVPAEIRAVVRNLH